MTDSNPALKSRQTASIITLIYGLLAAGAIAGTLLGATIAPQWRWLHYLTKPAATALLLYYTLSLAAPFSARYRNAIALGLAFAIGGDFFLMLPQDYFLAGLICFLLTHCAYIYALLSDHLPVKPLIFTGFALIALLIFAGLWHTLPTGMAVPVAIYAAALALMAALAVNRAFCLPAAGKAQQQAAQIAALGSVLFVISDSILAYGRFRFDIPLNPLFVLGTYYAAQWCFARSVTGKPA
ncbi:lysoplasmalogenase [Pseudochrobactrum sp. HB0163]|uniref:lysoplasmalogenase n=1 Tax=Pseudochrobactrum sp. HB0163 TaxID=3450708 RepID=UPI003F6DAD35